MLIFREIRKCRRIIVKYMYSLTSPLKNIQTIRGKQKYLYTSTPQYLFGVVPTAVHLPVLRYFGDSICSNSLL